MCAQQVDSRLCQKRKKIVFEFFELSEEGKLGENHVRSRRGMVRGNDSRPENGGPGVKSRHEGSSDKDAADAVNVIGKSRSSDIYRNRTPAVATPAERSGEQQQQQHHRLLLCCVCQEQSTTYRYEVVYKSAGVTASSDDPAISPGPGSPVIAGFFPGPRPICYSSDDSRFLNGGQQQQLLLSRSLDLQGEQDDNCYYNFPVRHPRHGHLKWAVPAGPQSTSALVDGGAFDGTFDGTVDLGGTVACAAPSYPDYPVHIRTTTLKRVVVSSLNRGKKNSPVKRTLQEIEVTTTNQGLKYKKILGN